MKKNKVVLFLSCIFSIAFLVSLFKLSLDIKRTEENILASPNVIDVTNKIKTKLLVSSENFNSSAWTQLNFNDANWKEVEVPKHRIVQEPEFKEGNYAYYRIVIPKSSLDKLNYFQNELSFSPQYVLLSHFDVYINGTFYRSYTPKSANEFLIVLPVQNGQENIISIKGFIKTGDTGINHRGHIFLGKGVELNELFLKSYKVESVYPLLFLISKGSILFVFTLIFLLVNVEAFFAKSIMFGLFAVLEDLVVGGYLEPHLNLNQQVYFFNVADIGMILFLFLFLSDVLKKKVSNRMILSVVSVLVVFSFLIALDVLHRNFLFNIDHFLMFWNLVMIVTLINFIPRLFQVDKVMSFVLSVSLFLTLWSTFFSGNVGYNLKAFGNLFISLIVAYQTFLLFRREQIQLMEQEKDVAIGKTAAILAHDVRRPLDQMKLILNRIIAGEASDEFLKIAQQDVNSSIANVSNQINDMMSFSRTKEIELTPISLYSVLASAIKQVVSVKKNVELSLEYDFNNSNMILGDESRLSSVFANLIANAIEAIQEIGKKKSGVLKFTTWKSKDYFILTIYNDGPHIPVNHLGEIFKPLFTSGKNQGTGLGLASASKIMNDHKGSIEVKNIEPTGVEFKMNFKLSIVEDAYHKEKFLSDSRSYVYKPLQNAAPDQKKVLRILLLDDDQYVYEYFLDVIKTIPYSIELGHFKDYESAKAGVVSKRYDLYILDYDLGDLKNGLDFYKENLSFLKSNVILHTNRDKRTIDYLTLDVFAKPVNSQDLTSLCDKAYNSRERILLVEDSKIISIGWKMFHGKHNINTVSSPEEALSFLETESNSIDICVLDYYFENSYMNGEELAMIIREKYPSLRILIASSTNVENNNIVSIKKTNFEIRGLG